MGTFVGEIVPIPAGEPANTPTTAVPAPPAPRFVAGGTVSIPQADGHSSCDLCLALTEAVSKQSETIVAQGDQIVELAKMVAHKA